MTSRELLIALKLLRIGYGTKRLIASTKVLSIGLFVYVRFELASDLCTPVDKMPKKINSKEYPEIGH